MARKKTEEVAALDAATVENTTPLEINDGSATTTTIGSVVLEDIPAMTDPSWSDYVMRQFAEDEIFDGMPTVDGLRRVAELLIGEIVVAQAHSVAAPGNGNGRDLNCATAEFTVTFVNNEGTPKTYTEIADVTINNTDSEYKVYPSAMAATRAEGRAYRKALKLKRVVAAEEVKEVAAEEVDASAKIKESQVRFLNILCKKNNINLMKFINSKGSNYKHVNDVPLVNAERMFSVLSEYQRKRDTIPEGIKGWVNAE